MQLMSGKARDLRWLRLAASGVAIAAVAWGGSRLFFRSGPDEPESLQAKQVAQLQHQRDVKGLSQAAKQPDPVLAVRAVQALGDLPGAEARQAVDAAARDARPAVREAAMSQYARVGSRDDVGVLRSAVATDREPAVRAAAAKTLGELRSWNGLEALLAGLNDSDVYVRRCSMAAIERITGVHYPYDADGPADQRARMAAVIRADLPKLKPAYDAYMRKLGQSGSRP